MVRIGTPNIKEVVFQLYSAPKTMCWRENRCLSSRSVGKKCIPTSVRAYVPLIAIHLSYLVGGLGVSSFISVDSPRSLQSTVLSTQPAADGLHEGRPGLLRGDPSHRVRGASHPGAVGSGKRHPKRAREHVVGGCLE